MLQVDGFGGEIVQADDGVAICQKAVDQGRSDESGSAGDQRASAPPYPGMNAGMHSRRVTVIAAALIAVATVVRAILAFSGYFYWDDLILVGRAGTQNLFSPGYLFDDHDGHVMPGGFLLGGVITRAPPLVWFWPALSLVVLQLAAWLALLRTLYLILGWRPVLLLPLTFALFTCWVYRRLPGGPPD